MIWTSELQQTFDIKQFLQKQNDRYGDLMKMKTCSEDDISSAFYALQITFGTEVSYLRDLILNKIVLWLVESRLQARLWNSLSLSVEDMNLIATT